MNKYDYTMCTTCVHNCKGQSKRQCREHTWWSYHPEIGDTVPVVTGELITGETSGATADHEYMARTITNYGKFLKDWNSKRDLTEEQHKSLDEAVDIYVEEQIERTKLLTVVLNE